MCVLILSHSFIATPPQVSSYPNSAFLGISQNPLCQGYLVDIVVIEQAQLKLQAQPHISKPIIQSSNISSNKHPSQPKYQIHLYSTLIEGSNTPPKKP